MTKVKFWIGAWLSLCCLHAAGSVQQSISQLGGTNNWVLAFRWTGDASSGSVPTTASQMANCCQGYLITQVETVPGSPAPTNGYSVAIQDAAGVDALNGAAASCSSSTPQSFAASTAAPPVQGSFSLVITGQSVAGAKGTVFVFLSKPGTVNLATIGSGGGVASSANWLTIANAPFVDTRRYNFAAQSPGGTLSAGTPATFTVTASGVDASDTGHYLYIAGTGTPEAVLITGGTGSSIQFTPANNHTAGWTIASATGGIQEAVNVATTGGTILISSVTVHGATTVGKSLFFLGGGDGSVITVPAGSTFDVFNVIWGGANTFQNFAITAPSRLSGGSGIKMTSSFLSRIENVSFTNLYNGVQAVSASAWTVNICHFVDINNYAIINKDSVNPDTGGATVSGNAAYQTGAWGVAFVSHESSGNLKVINNSVNGYNYAVIAQPMDGSTGQLFIQGNAFEGQAIYGILLGAAGGGFTRYATFIQDNWLANWTITGWLAIYVSDTTSAYTDSIVSGNLVKGIAASTNFGMVMESGARWVIGTNYWTQLEHGLIFKPSVSNSKVAVQHMITVVDPLQSLSATIESIQPVDLTYAQLTAGGALYANGSQIFCSDCNSTCAAGASTGRTCFRENGAWVH